MLVESAPFRPDLPFWYQCQYMGTRRSVVNLYVLVLLSKMQ
jgi:hypothetical protein